MSIASSFDSIGRDLRHSVRRLLRRPTFTFAAAITLALGIGATTAIFSVVYSVLIKPLPYPNADELVWLGHDVAGNPSGFEPTMYLTYRDENRTLANIGLWQEGSATLADRGMPERVRVLRVTDGTLQTLGVEPLRGRGFTEQEHELGAEGPVPIILSHAFWQRRFGGDEAAIGRELSIDSRPSTVVGVMPPDFTFLDMRPQPDLILAVQLAPAADQVIMGALNYAAVARLAPGVTPAEAQTDLERTLAIWREAWPLPPADLGVTRDVIANLQIAPVVRPLKEEIVGGVAGVLWVLMGAIGGVLLIACANIANLMLVRADARRQEFAVRAALGAVPAQIARQLLVESFVVSAIGGVLGLLLAYLGLRALVGNAPSDLPRLQEIAVYPPVLVFALAVSVISTLLFGSIAATRYALHIDSPKTLAARGTSASRDQHAMRNILVIVQVALAFVLLVSASLMIRTFEALSDVDPGFSNPSTIQTTRIWIPTTLVPDPVQYTRMQREILENIAALPGVTSAGFASALPLEASQNSFPLLVEGQPPLAAGDLPPFRGGKFVSPGYFESMGTRIIAGRDITWSDIEAGGRVVVISEEFARELSPDPAGALGKRVRTFLETDAWREVVGVVEGVHETGLYESRTSFVYFPALVEDMFGAPTLGTPAAALAIRSERAGTATLSEEIRQAIRSVNGSIPITSERPMQALYSGSLARTSFVLVMLAIAGVMALLLGIVGIYGVISYVVSQRTREIGIRSALGAEPRQLRKMFLLHGLTLGGLGLVAGLVVAAFLARLMSSLLFGIGPMDPMAYMAAIVVILAATALASYLPARRAATIDPMDTLRAE